MALVSAMLALSGCTTTYVGQKIGPEGALTKPGGVPFVLTKPEYTLNITADSAEPTKPVHTLNVSYVPDATQRFTLALDPALFVNGKLELDFGEKGNLTGAASITTTRVIETFGALVASAIKAQTVGLLDAASTLTAYKDALTGSTDQGCKALVTLLEEFEADAQTEIPDRENAKRARADWVGERLHYLGQTQRECMTVVVKKMKQDDEDNREKEFKADFAASEKAAGDDAELILLNRDIKAEVAALSEDALGKIADGLTGKPDRYAPAKKAARSGELFVKFRLAGRFARSLAEMGPDVWRARHLAYLERKIAKCRIELLVPESKSGCGEGSEIAKRIAALTAEWARTLGETAIVERIARIDGLLSSIQISTRNDQGRRSVVEENVKLREERDKLQVRVDQVRSDLISRNKIVALGPDIPKATKVEPRTNVSVTLVKAAYVSAVNSKPAAFDSALLPEFVLVLEPDNSGAVAPLPTPKGATK